MITEDGRASRSLLSALVRRNLLAAAKWTALAGFTGLGVASFFVPWAEEVYRSRAFHVPYILILAAACAFAAWAAWSRCLLDQTSQSYLLAAAFAGLGIVFLPHALLDPRSTDPAHIFFSPASRLIFGFLLVAAMVDLPVPRLMRRPRLAFLVAAVSVALVIDVVAHLEWIRNLLGEDPQERTRMVEAGALALETIAMALLAVRWLRTRRQFLATIGQASLAMGIGSILFLGSTVWEGRWWLAHLGLLFASLVLILGVSRQLCRAIEHNELLLHYMPKVDLRSGEVVGVEALVRWQHPDRGLISPALFMPLAEQTDLIKPLTIWVLNSALGQHRSWLDAGLNIPVAVNLSARLMLDPHLVEIVGDALRAWDLEPSALELELTETAFLDLHERVLEVFAALDAMGIRLAIDDFGTGYSSLAYLKSLPVREIKIDQSFVRDMARDESDLMIVRSTIQLGHSLGRELVAEGVEGEDAFKILSRMGCDLGQGYLWSAPLPADEFSRWVAHFQVRSVSGSKQ